MARLHTTLELRKLFQLSQADLAILINRSQVIVSQYETGERSETAELYGRLREFCALFEVPADLEKSNPWIDTDSLEQEAETWRLREKEYLEAMIWRLGKKLSKMEEVYRKGLRALNLYGQIQANPDTPKDVFQWTRIIYPKLEMAVRLNSPLHQAKIRTNIAGLKGKVKALSNEE